MHLPHATAKPGEKAELMPACHATCWDTGSLCTTSFFTDSSRSCRNTYTWMKIPQTGGGLQLACTHNRGKQGGSHMEVKRLSSRGKLVMPEILKLWINLHQISIPSHRCNRYPTWDGFYCLLVVTMKICSNPTRPKFRIHKCIFFI